MKHYWPLGILTLVLTTNGCSYMRNAFPDKEKEYRFNHELPELVLPDNEENGTTPFNIPRTTESSPSSAITAPAAAIASKPAKRTAESKSAATTTPTPAKAAAQPQYRMNEQMVAIPQGMDRNYAAEVDLSEKPAVTESKLVTAPNAPGYIQLNQALPHAWQIVSKALTRKALEITRRDESKHLLEVQYEPEVKVMTDETLEDKWCFIFCDENNQERKYQILLSPEERQTKLTVLDAELQACNDEKCAQLLTTIQQALQEVIKKD